MADGSETAIAGAIREFEYLGAHGQALEAPTAAELSQALNGTQTWWYAGFEINGVPVLATPAGGELRARQPGTRLSDSHLYAPTIEEYVKLVGAAAQAGALKSVVLNACNTLELGRALVEAGVSRVICWETPVEDWAASIFGCALASAVAAGKSADAAYEAARAAISKSTEHATVGGAKLEVPRYQLDVDPRHYIHSGGRVAPRIHGATRGPVAAGIPRILHSPTALADVSASAALASASAGKRAASPGASSDTSVGSSTSFGSGSLISSAMNRLAVESDREDYVDDEDAEVVYRSLGAVPVVAHPAARAHEM